MPSPTYDGAAIFDSKRDGTHTFNEGVLYVDGDYTPIIQVIHFNGMDGDNVLVHGYADREWTYEGILSSTSLADLMSKISTIENKVDDFVTNPTTYKVLVDNFGNSFTNAQIRHFKVTERPHIEANGNWFCRIRVAGVVQGMKSNHDGGTNGVSSSS